MWRPNVAQIGAMASPLGHFDMGKFALRKTKELKHCQDIE
jgi:hypothetical protein